MVQRSRVADQQKETVYSLTLSRPLPAVRTLQPGHTGSDEPRPALSSLDAGVFRAGGMRSTLPVLLCLGLSLQERPRGSSGTLPKPILWAEPGPVIPRGRSVTLWCQGSLDAQKYCLIMERTWRATCRRPLQGPGNRAMFPIPTMTAQDAGEYQCYYQSPAGSLQRSERLELVVTGFYSKPSLSALPSPVVTSGGKVTLQCGSWKEFDGFILAKEGEHNLTWTLDSQQKPSGQFQAEFSVDSVTPSHRWTFACYGYYRSKPQVWSIPSDPLNLLVSGQPPVTPSLSVQPGPTVSSGENVTLLCQSQIKMDTFLLCKEGAADPPLRLRAEYRAPWYQAEFSMRAVTSALGGTYRCYGSHSSSPYLLSRPSAPLDLVVPGGPEDQPLTPTDPGPQSGLGRSLKILVGVSVPLLLLLLLLLQGHQCRGQCRKAGLSTAVTSPEATQGHQVAASESSQVVTYALLKDLKLREGTATPPSSQEGKSPALRSDYATLAFH
ncbi:leukocyte immunoglobulin-like receptor subfamily B member 3 [Marmota flaviventris]|uniref:leukocyte immunoglobulin-like receptor subfamily B member 3 n=1 Tax=Marmota flaviventris TaxID=93162 RepID=UPI003A8B008F